MTTIEEEDMEDVYVVELSAEEVASAHALGRAITKVSEDGPMSIYMAMPSVPNTMESYTAVAASMTTTASGSRYKLLAGYTYQAVLRGDKWTVLAKSPWVKMVDVHTTHLQPSRVEDGCIPE